VTSTEWPAIRWFSSLIAAGIAVVQPACGHDVDDRPLSAQYLVPAIFQPSCGTAACHSSAAGRAGLVLDTVDGVCDASDPDQEGPLTQYMTDDAEKRMPLDSPLPRADIELLWAWYFVDGDPDGTPFEPPAGCP